MKFFKKNPFTKLEKRAQDTFIQKGYSIHTPSTSNDHGIDLIAENGDQKIAVQVTQPSESSMDKSIEAAISGKEAFNCNKSVIVVDSQISDQFRNKATENGIDVINVDGHNNFQ